MKGEYRDPKSETATMFSKIHHPQPLHHHHPFSHHFHLTPSATDRQASDDDVAASHTTTTTTLVLPPPDNPKGGGPGDTNINDGATIEVVRRPRGRPPGSKNKPKPPVVITREPEPAMSPYILEVPGGNDIVEAISRFCRRKGTGLCVLTGSGTVANFTLRQPGATSSAATITFHGRFDILSISATFLPQTTSHPVPNGFSISVGGPQGQIVGGAVAGPLVAAGTVFIVAASFNNPSYHRLPDEQQDECRKSASESQSPPMSGGGDSGKAPPQHPDLYGASMYSCHLPSDVTWAPPASRQPY